MNAFYTGSHRYLSQDDIDGIQSIYGNRTVVRTTNLSCAGGTFFINNLPVGATVNWISSNNLIATVVNNNNEGIVTWTGTSSGQVRITGTITLPCGTTVTEFMDVIFGSIQPGPIQVNLIDQQLGRIEVEVDDAISGGPYNWYKNGVLVSGYHANWAKIPIPRGVCDVDYGISVETANACGTSPQSFIVVYVPCEEYYRMSPNPASSEVTVSADQTKAVKGTNATLDEVRIYDQQGNLKKFQKYGKVKTARINISGLPNGIYFIEIINGEYKERKQLNVQH